MLDVTKPESEENLAASLAFANALYAGLQLTLKEAEKCDQMIEGVCRFPQRERARKDQILLQLWTRAYAWLKTLETLNRTMYYQSAATACRTMLEIVVDVALLCKGDGDGLASKMLIFFESEKLRMCEQVVSYYNKVGEPIPSHHQMFADFVTNEKSNVENNRRIMWGIDRKGKPIHPNRWTKNDLSQDVEKVDQAYGQIIVDELGMSLECIYRTEYRWLNWHIHSGTPSTWMMPAESFDITMGSVLKRSADLAILCAKLILSDLKLNLHLDDVHSRWSDLDNARSVAFFDISRP